MAENKWLTRVVTPVSGINLTTTYPVICQIFLHNHLLSFFSKGLGRVQSWRRLMDKREYPLSERAPTYNWYFGPTCCRT